MIARALAQEPKIMVLDEPTAFLDLPSRVEVMGLLGNLAHGTERTILVATHDLDIALRVADRIWLLPTNGPLKAGMPEELIIDGSFERVFHGNGIEFDNASGSFKLKSNYHHQVGLTGEGLTALWTARAFEREGFEVLDDDRCLPLRVRIVVQGKNVYWQVSAEVGRFTLESLSDVVSVMKEVVSAGSEYCDRSTVDP
jgi:iron complex transport system ATP-binding protein